MRISSLLTKLKFTRKLLKFNLKEVNLLKFCFPSAFTGSVYATVLVTLERYVAISWPLKAKRWTSIQKSILCSLTVFLLAIAVNFPRWFEVRSSFLLRVGNWTEDGEIISSKGRFVKKVGSMLRTRWYMEYYQQAWIFLVYVLPITGLILLNFCIWRAVRNILETCK